MICEISERARPLANQIHRLIEPGFPLALVLITPQTALLQFRFYEWKKLCHRHCLDVFPIHPERFLISPISRIPFGEVKDRVRFVDSFEREELDQFFPRKYFAISSGFGSCR